MDMKGKLLFEEKIRGDKAAFKAKLNAISAALGVNPNWLMAIFYKESGVNPAAVSPGTKATGLIQFMPATAKGLGTSVDALAKMDSVTQMDYVLKFFTPYKKYLKSYADLYLVTFFPAALYNDDNWLFQAQGMSAEAVGKANPAINGGQPINKTAFTNYLFKGISSNLKPYLA